MKIVAYIRSWARFLSEPKEEFIRRKEESFEKAVVEYLYLLILCGVLSGLVNFLFGIGRALYLDIYQTVEIEYWNMVNFMVGEATSIVFLYLFAGTFLLFILSIFLRRLAKGVKYTNLLKVMIYSLTPLLLFSWLPFLVWTLLIWTIVIMYIGISAMKGIDKVKKNSIEQRD